MDDMVMNQPQMMLSTLCDYLVCLHIHLRCFGVERYGIDEFSISRALEQPG
jgi:hypothetical protein